MEEYLFRTMTTSLALMVLYVLFRLFNSIWWRPKTVERLLRQQGIRGTSYKLLVGDLPDMMKITKEAFSKPMALNHKILPRVFPFIYKLEQQHGKVSLSWLGRRARVTIRDVEIIRLILANKNGHFVKPPRDNPLLNLLHRNNVSTLDGEKWSTRRRLITPAFHLDKLKAMMSASICTSCLSQIEQWQKLVNGQKSYELDVAAEFEVLTGDVISRAAFGSSYKEGKKIFELQDEQAILVSEALSRIYIPGFRFIPTKKNRRRYQLQNEINAILKDMIEKKREAMKKDELRGRDLLTLLLEYQEESVNSLTTEDVIEECKFFYFAGHETTANLLTWTMVVLSMHPNWQEKARQEVLEVCAGRTPDFDAINRLNIVSMILFEVLRLYPPVPAVLRYAECDTKVGSLSIPAGVELFLPFLQLHHDTRYWGDNAEELEPERFSEGISKASKDQNAFYPFSWGPRICIGQHLALIEAKMSLTMILQNFSFELSPAYAHAPSTRLTLKPQHGVPIILHPL